MHGLGNDFVIIDTRNEPFAIDDVQARLIADRRIGVGCDQLILLEPSKAPGADIFMRILNSDGSEAGACGNGTRCVADLVMRETGDTQLVIETIAGLLEAERVADGNIAVDMGRARLDWRDVPLARAMDTLRVDLELGPLKNPAACSMGNPHATFFVDDMARIDLAALGPVLERAAVFPDRANIGVVQVLERDRIRFRVWERGAGITVACGSGACAALVNAARRGLTQREATVILDGGELRIAWLPDDHVLMTGPVATAFTGELPAA
jgi:diaminopimelate epimerase